MLIRSRICCAQPEDLIEGAVELSLVGMLSARGQRSNISRDCIMA
jgi:hypothetical protein